jgi:plastocyanin
MPRRPLAVLATAAVLAVAAAGCGGSESSSSSTGPAVALKPGEPIGMKSLRFHPDRVKVAVGQQVTWRNDEGVPHNVVADSGADFESESFGKDKTFSWTPAKAGAVKYECTLHPGMTGELDVVAR